MVITLLIVASLALAFSNGANDNFKGFATVWGAQALSYRHALLFATIATLAGSMVSIIIAEGLLDRFSGKGLVPDDIAADPSFIFAVGGGAAMAVTAATRLGLPVSTTHALIGGLVGAALGTGGGVNLATLGGVFLAPLLVSPLLSASLAFAAYAGLRLRPSARDCACVTAPGDGIVSQAEAALVETPARLVVATEQECTQLSAPLRVSITALLDRVHILSAATVCFARSVNDTPKLTALLVAAHTLDERSSAGLVALAMGLGGLIFARRVAETMSLRINRLDATQGLSANLATAGLVLCASTMGLPVSTTHVSVGAIVGVGAHAGSIDWAVLRNVLLSWVATLPFAAACAWLLSRGVGLAPSL